ncbi:MAG: alginate lyase family protein [Muribaculaceae bacterium]|nr:alginate lyase family protein [Muribaculaceae bacterium]
MKKILSILVFILFVANVGTARSFRNVFPANFANGVPAGWAIGNSASYKIVKGGVEVTCALQDKGKYRGDITYNTSPNNADNNFGIDAGKYKVFAVSFIGGRPANGVIKLQNISVNGAWIGDNADYGLKVGNNQYAGDIVDSNGNHTYYWTLPGDKWTGTLTINKIELVIADITDENQRIYTVSKIRWFESADAAKSAVLNKAAVIGDSDYPTLEEAWYAAVSGETIELQKDIELSECLSSKGRNLTVKGNGYKISRGAGYEGLLFCTGLDENGTEVSEKEYALNHPCLLHTQEDFNYVRERLGSVPATRAVSSDNIYAKALAKLKSGQYCSVNHAASPVKYLARLDANNWGDITNAAVKKRWENAGILDLWYQGIEYNYTNLMRDAAAAYQLSLLYKLEDNTAAADKAIEIMVAWANENEGVLRNSKGEIIDPNEKLILFQPYQLAIAAELLRDYDGWGDSEEFRRVAQWLEGAFYQMAHDQLDDQNKTEGGHYWFNWDLAAMTSILAIGVLNDNQDYINEAIMYYKGIGGGPGNIFKGVPFVHDDPDSDELIGQGNECGRDQGHNTLCAAVLGVFCQMGMALGEDLFAYGNYRALAYAEYVAKYNLAKSDLYPDTMKNFTGMQVGASDSDFEYAHSSFPFTEYTYGDKGTMTQPSEDGRGSVRPGWDIWAGYANSNGQSAIYCNKFAERMRPDGGGGHYSPNSGGFDQLGMSTLLYYRP